MPYKIKGRSVYKGNKKIGTSEHPKEYLHVLNAVAHGWKPTRKSSRKK